MSRGEAPPTALLGRLEVKSGAQPRQRRPRDSPARAIAADAPLACAMGKPGTPDNVCYVEVGRNTVALPVGESAGEAIGST